MDSPVFPFFSVVKVRERGFPASCDTTLPTGCVSQSRRTLFHRRIGYVNRR